MGKRFSRRKKHRNNGEAAGGNQENNRMLTASVPAAPASTAPASTTKDTITEKEETTMSKKPYRKNTKTQPTSRRAEEAATSGAISVKTDSLVEQYVWLDNAILQISPDIQRKLDPMRVADIQRNFSPLVVNPIKVSFRDGKYYIFDGMHTRTALCGINGTDSFPILCRVYHGLTKEDEANLFATQFGISKAVPLAYRLRAWAVAKDPAVLDFLDTTKGCGFAISLGSHISCHGRIAATCSAYKAYEDLGQEQYCRMLKLLHRTWAGESWSVSRNMLGGMSRFMRMYDFQDAAFVNALRGITYEEVVIEADRFPGMTRDGAFATALGEIFDRNSSSRLRPIS